MRVLLAGGGGQLGRALLRGRPEGVEVTAPGSAELDITSRNDVLALVRALRPDVVINAAAWTNVDAAEQARESAFAVNADGPGWLAEAASDAGARLIQVSTDYVFDGRQGRPYRPDDPTTPLGVYGASKLEGERRVRAVLGDHALILRTAWVYSHERHNFLLTMLRLMRERDALSIVDDQIGTPTHAVGLAAVIWRWLALDGPGGIHHWTDAGVASWYDFAVAIRDEAAEMGLLPRRVPVIPIPGCDYPTPAPRPACSVLDKTSTREILGENGRHWREALVDCLILLKG